MEQHGTVMPLTHGPERLERRIGRVEAGTPGMEIQALEPQTRKSVFQPARSIAVVRVDRGQAPEALRREGDELRNFLVAHKRDSHCA